MSSRYLMLLALGLLLFGCSSQPSPRDVLISSIQKSANLDSLTVELEMNMTFSQSDGITVATAKIVQYSKGNSTRLDMNIVDAPWLEGFDLRIYSLENGTYLCGKSYSWDCLEFNSSLGLGGEAVVGFSGVSSRSMALINSGALEFMGNVEKQEVMGRPCSLVSAKIDYSKIKESWAGFQKNIKNVILSECLDEELGIPLRERLVMELETDQGETVISQMDFEVLNIDTNSAIAEAMFELPKKY